jgi:cell division septal protein FtsQ
MQSSGARRKKQDDASEFCVAVSRRGLMEIKTNRSRELQSSGLIPPPDKARQRKKTPQKLSKGTTAGQRYVSAMRNSMKIGAFLLIIAFVVSIFLYVHTSEKFSLRNITFYGCKEVDPQKLAEIVRRDFPSNLLRIDLRQLKNRLEEEIWVNHVEIRRVLPSELAIYVHERIPSVILEMHNDLMIADQDGIMLGRYDPRFGKLDVPVFRGVLGKDAEDYRQYQEENTARIHQALAMLSEIGSGSPQFTKRISEVDISDRKNLKILLVDDTAEIYLGEKDYWKRLNAFLKQGMYRKLKDKYREFEYIDLRFDDQIVYLPKGTEGASINDRSIGPEDSKADR